MKANERQNEDRQIVAIGTSTGGPRALQRVLTELPEDFSAPIVIVQHMPKGFTKSLAERLHRESALVVKEASHRDCLKRGHVYVAPGGYHMKINFIHDHLEIELTKEALHLGHRPSVDVLFHSIAKLPHVQKVAVVLTGMGKDGANGVQQIKSVDESAVVIAESSESAIINGMPAAAVDTGYTTYVLHLKDISTSLYKIVNRRG